MISFVRRLGDLLGLPSEPKTEPDEALEKLRQASQLAKDYRRRRERTGNMVEDMTRGAYVPPRRRAHE